MKGFGKIMRFTVTYYSVPLPHIRWWKSDGRGVQKNSFFGIASAIAFALVSDKWNFQLFRSDRRSSSSRPSTSNISNAAVSEHKIAFVLLPSEHVHHLRSNFWSEHTSEPFFNFVVQLWSYLACSCIDVPSNQSVYHYTHYGVKGIVDFLRLEPSLNILSMWSHMWKSSSSCALAQSTCPYW